MPHKLIRDKVPEIIRASGRNPEVSVLNQEEFIQVLRKKLVEESQEVLGAQTEDSLIEEIADIYEVLDSLIQVLELDKVTILQKQNDKRLEKGSFTKKLALRVCKIHCVNVG